MNKQEGQENYISMGIVYGTVISALRSQLNGQTIEGGGSLYGFELEFYVFGKKFFIQSSIQPYSKIINIFTQLITDSDIYEPTRKKRLIRYPKLDITINFKEDIKIPYFSFSGDGFYKIEDLCRAYEYKLHRTIAGSENDRIAKAEVDAFFDVTPKEVKSQG